MFRQTPGRAQRRTRADWRRLVQEWERSGLPAAAFAERRRVRAQSLYWWRWFLRRDDSTRLGETALAPLTLVPVEVDGGFDEGDEPAATTPAWELLAPSGHVLRVHDRTAVALLREVVAAMTTSGRRR